MGICANADDKNMDRKIKEEQQQQQALKEIQYKPRKQTNFITYASVSDELIEQGKIGQNTKGIKNNNQLTDFEKEMLNPDNTRAQIIRKNTREQLDSDQRTLERIRECTKACIIKKKKKNQSIEFEQEILNKQLDDYDQKMLNPDNTKAKIIKISKKTDKDMLNPYNTKSKIIKIVQKTSQKENNAQIYSKGNNRIKKSQFLKDNLSLIIEGEFRSELYNSTLRIKNKDIDLEFTLSKIRAGPLIVPSIGYDLYSLQFNSKQ